MDVTGKQQSIEIDAIKLLCTLLTYSRDGKYLFERRNTLPAALFSEISMTYQQMGQDIAPELIRKVLIEWFANHSIRIERTYAFNEGAQYD